MMKLKKLFIDFPRQYSDVSLLHIISLIFIILNIFTLEWCPFPWIDEVSLADISANFALDGEWRTTACGGDRYGEVYSLYHPLYQFVLVPWFWLFGVSPLACRSISLVFAYFCCLIIYDLLRNTHVVKNKYALIVFVLLFWSAEVFSWIYRNGRVDILNMLCVVGFARGYYMYLYKGGSKWILFLFSFLILLSGIQSCPYVLGLLIYSYFFLPDKKSVRSAVYMFLGGVVGGMFCLSIFFYLQGHLLQFYYGYIQYSDTIKKLALFVYPYINDIYPLSMDIKEALLKLDNSVQISFFEKIVAAYTVNKEYLILCFPNLIVYLWFLYKRHINFNSTETKLLFIVILIPLLMSIAGRFPAYYTWMCYMPSIIYGVYLVEKYKKQLFVSVIYGLVTLLIVSSGLPKTLLTADKDAYRNVETFVEKQNFKEEDKIVSAFVSYYPIRNITKNCYFIGVYPLSLLPDDTKYILKAEDDYKSENMDIYIKQCEAKGKMVQLVDSLDSPRMKLYVVE